MRNWIIGYYIVEYEQHGDDKAEYGEKLFKKLAERLKNAEINGFSFTSLHLCKQLYLAYPQIIQAVSEQFQNINFHSKRILQTVSEVFKEIRYTQADLLINRLSFSHFVELIKSSNPLKRLFYETQIIHNSWSVRELQRAMNSMLFERTGLSTDKKGVLEKYTKEADLKPEDVFRNPYLLEFLGLEEKSSYSETDLEKAIIDHLQKFLLEMGRGFCFEARQRRITFDNTHYRIDLVFYHRILKCHILLDLKIGDFDHSDAGQMNMYLNYYKDNESDNSDNTPIGIILCSGKNEALVKYATMGLPQQVFVSKYLINLPTEKELQKIIESEKEKIQ